MGRGRVSWTRRTAVQAAALLAGGGAAGLVRWGGQWLGLAAAQVPQAAEPLTTITFNCRGLTGWPACNLRARRLRSEGGLLRLAADTLAAYRADLVTLAEAPAEADARELARQMGLFSAWWPGRGGFPGAVLSRWPIVRADDLGAQPPGSAEPFSRHWGRVVVHRGTAADLIVHSLHLAPHQAAARRREIEVVCRTLADDLAGGGEVLVQGDLNHQPAGSEYQAWINLGLEDVVDRAAEGSRKTFPALIPLERLDYILASGRLSRRLRAAQVLDLPPFRPAGPLDFSLSDHLPCWARFA